MRRCKARRILMTWSMSLAAIGLLAGCPGGGTIGPIHTPPLITGASVTTPTGTLTQNTASVITVRATTLDTDGTVQAVTADLSAIGGPAAQPLTFDSTNDLWSSVLSVAPTVVGARTVTVAALDSNNLTARVTTSVTVVASGGGGGSVPPTLTNAVSVGTLTTNFASQITLSVTVTDVNATVTTVTADLLPIGGLMNQSLVTTAQNPNIWIFTGLVTPPLPGTFPIVFTATNNFGDANTTSITVVVNNPIP